MEKLLELETKGKRTIMKTKFLLTFMALLFAATSCAQNSEALVRNAIQNYFFGTMYNYTDNIRAAFHPETKLFLENRDGELMVISREDYIGYFKGKPGDFNNRYSKILSIDIEGNLAFVKAEILIPSVKKRYVDFFILREMTEDKWEIIGKAANSGPMKEE